MVNPKGISHDYTPVPRPESDGRLLVRWPSGFYRATTRTAENLSGEVCAMCGHALTATQQERYLRTGSARHSAIPALYYVGK
jgi:hypothetical protein